MLSSIIRLVVSSIQAEQPLHMLETEDFAYLRNNFATNPVLGHEVCREALRRLTNTRRSSNSVARSAARKQWRHLRALFAEQIIAQSLPMPTYRPVVSSTCYGYIACAVTDTGRCATAGLYQDYDLALRVAKEAAQMLNQKHGAV